MSKSLPNYTKLLTYWYTVLVYDHTAKFCNRWIKSYKLSEQMTGAARSAKQNLVEGSEVMGTSLKSVIKLTNVARGSLEELIADLEDFLRQRGLEIWHQEDPRVLEMRRRNAHLTGNLRHLRDQRNPRVLKLFKEFRLPDDPEKAANFLLTLANQGSSLIRKQVEGLERKHKKEGGYTEKLYKRRKNYRGY